MQSLNPLRAYTAHLLALSIRELFPQAQLLGGEVNEIGFFYRFRCPQPLSLEILPLMEEKMRGFVKAPPPMRLQEMVPSNAALLFHDLKEYLLEERCLESEEILVSVIGLGKYWDLAIDNPKPMAHFAFALLELKSDGEAWEIFGSAFPEKDEVKGFIKRYRESKKNDWRVIGPRLKWLVAIGDKPLWLTRGVLLEKKFYDLFKESLPPGSREVKTPSSSKKTFIESHTALFEAEPGGAIWEWHETGDILTHFLLKEEVDPFLKSSLQFFEKTLKMLGFESYHKLEEPGPCIEFRLYDKLGRSFKGPQLKIDRTPLPSSLQGKVRVTRTFFPDLQTMMLKWIEVQAVSLQ